MRVIWALGVAVWLAAAGGAAAQRSFVQIEAHRSLDETLDRARAYGGLFDNVGGYRLDRRWFGLALGPYPSPEAATAAMRTLRGQGLVPRDSYVTDGGALGERVWPEDGALPAPAPSAAAPALPERAVAPAPPDETPAEARRSEARLARAEREDLQRALQWFGHYAARIDGAFGRGTRASMAAWQAGAGVEPTGVLTTAQRGRLLAEWREAQAALGLRPLVSAEAGVALTAPLGLVRFDRVEAPFVHYAPRDGSGMRMALISQRGDRAALGGLYEIMQTLDVVPATGDRARSPTGFRIRGEAADRRTEVVARLEGDHILGFLLSWPPERDRDAARALEAMEATLAPAGPPLPPDAGFDAEAQSLDTVSGLEVRRPLRAASGVFVDAGGAVATAAANVEGCGRVTVDRAHEATVALRRDGVAVLRPRDRLTPARVASLADAPGRLRSPVAVAGYPFGGVLGAPTLTFGTLEDLRGLDGGADTLRLALAAAPGDVGGPVLDEAGRLAGLLLSPPDAGGRALPADVALARDAAALRRVLAEAGVAAEAAAPAAALPPERLAERAAEMTVLVSCWE